ncbi:MAG: hypothetical protein JWQ51_2874, partial [Tardiphaga sp.]|nr:hypothetical protein [Tardiphaga sp.]
MDYDFAHSAPGAAPERKAGLGGEHDAMMRMFDEFKSANDERLDRLERR